MTNKRMKKQKTRHSDLYYEGNGSYSSSSRGYLFGGLLCSFSGLFLFLKSDWLITLIALFVFSLGMFVLGGSYAIKKIGIKFNDKRFPAEDPESYY